MPGAERLRDSAVLKDLLKQQQASDRFVTAICAAPAVVLEAQGFLEGKKATSHPGFTDKLSDKRSVCKESGQMLSKLHQFRLVSCIS